VRPGRLEHGSYAIVTYAEGVTLVEVQFEPSGTVVMVQAGSTLLAASQAAGAEIVTGCTRGMCGTDAVLVEGPEQGLEPPDTFERGTLERMGLDSRFRLSCSARVRCGPLRVTTDAF
jgi:ferredoxin